VVIGLLRSLRKTQTHLRIREFILIVTIGPNLANTERTRRALINVLTRLNIVDYAIGSSGVLEVALSSEDALVYTLADGGTKVLIEFFTIFADEEYE
jgi:hypothetical protein